MMVTVNSQDQQGGSLAAHQQYINDPQVPGCAVFANCSIDQNTSPSQALSK